MRVCTGPFLRLARPATRGRATLFACAFRAPARRCLFSCHSTCPRQAWASDHAAPPLAPIGVAAAAHWVPAERLSVERREQARSVAAVVASPVPGAQLSAARLLARARVGVLMGARRGGRAPPPCPP